MSISANVLPLEAVGEDQWRRACLPTEAVANFPPQVPKQPPTWSLIVLRLLLQLLHHELKKISSRLMAWMLEECLADVYLRFLGSLTVLASTDRIEVWRGDGWCLVLWALMPKQKAKAKRIEKTESSKKALVTNESEWRKWWRGSFLPLLN